MRAPHGRKDQILVTTFSVEETHRTFIESGPNPWVNFGADHRGGSQCNELAYESSVGQCCLVFGTGRHHFDECGDGGGQDTYASHS